MHRNRRVRGGGSDFHGTDYHTNVSLGIENKDMSIDERINFKI